MTAFDDFETIEYENNDVDTDRGTMRDRQFNIVFKSGIVELGESDFIKLVDAIKKADYYFEY